jgi:hypothetical protein
MENLSRKKILNNKSGFIRISMLITIIGSVLVLGGGGYFGIKQYQGYRIKKAEKEKLANENKKIDDERQSKLQEILDSQSKELEKQKLEINALKNKPPIIIKNTEKIPTDSTGLSRADIIAQWTSNIAYIECTFILTGSDSFLSKMRAWGIDTRPVTLGGSGFVRAIQTKYSPSPIVTIITNRHVLNAHNGFSYPNSCEVTLPDNHKYTFGAEDVYYQTVKGDDDPGSGIEFIDGQPFSIPKTDAGFLWVKNPDQYIQSIATKPKLCDAFPRIGDDIIVLGYPGIGATIGITATEGIVSGMENDFFVTSAKVEHGNSGGVALYKDQNCYFGIPTFTRTGAVESLARILNYKKTFVGGY